MLQRKWRGTTKKISSALRQTGAPTFKFVPAPLYFAAANQYEPCYARVAY